MKISNRKGFTLIELLVVISIVGLLSSVILNATQNARQNARNKQRLQQIDQIEKAFSIYMTLSDTTKLPTTNVAGVQFFCLGQGGYYTASQRQCDPAISGAITANASIDTILSGVLGGGNIPRDPYFKTAFGNTYIYVSNTNPGGAPLGACTATTCPSGAYLVWVMENSANCGRGVTYTQNVNGTNNNSCYLRIGDAS